MMNKKNNSISNKISDQTFCVIDFETTGLSAVENRVIEVGIVKLRRKKVIDTYSTFVNPGVLLPEKIKMLTGIQDEDLIYAPSFENVALKIKAFISNSVLVAHNLSFDYSFLYNEFKRAEIELPPLMTLCTLKLSKKLFPELESKSLGSVVKYLKVRHKDVHRALGDSLATAKILMKMISLIETNNHIETIDELIRFSSDKNPNQYNQSISLRIDEQNIPQNPGVYFFKDKFDKIIYIGKSKSLRQRIGNHFQESAPKKSKKIIKKSSLFEYEETKSELSALIKESELIKEFNPKFNVLLKKYPKSYFLKMNIPSSFPMPEMTDEFNFDGCDYFGPFIRKDDVKTMINIINKSFELRECNDKIFSKSNKCYLGEIDRCVAPCINKSLDKYNKELEKVYKFLSGQNSIAIERLLSKMKSYAENKKYEEAADIRDTLKIIMNQIDRTSLLKEPINKTNVLIKIESGLNREFVLIKEGRVFINDLDGFDMMRLFILIEDFYNKTIFIENKFSAKDLNRIRITLSWLIKNKNSYKLHYLQDYASVEELQKVISK
ncbi:MAG: DEDD exonuclease domain-containing protein [Ignavibacteriales bacterium]